MELNGVVVQVNDVVLKEDKEPLGVAEVVVIKVGVVEVEAVEVQQMWLMKPYISE